MPVSAWRPRSHVSCALSKHLSILPKKNIQALNFGQNASKSNNIGLNVIGEEMIKREKIAGTAQFIMT